MDLAAPGFAVFPITLKPTSGDWTPILDWQVKAVSDPDRIRARWRANRDARVGLPTGARNGSSVLDIDRKNGKDGFAALAAMGIDAAELSPVRVVTPSGGEHLFLAHLDGLKNSAGAVDRWQRGRAKELQGLQKIYADRRAARRG